MKKILMIAAAALAVFAVSCKNGGGNKAAEPFVVPDGWDTFEDEYFAISYPAMEISSWGNGDLETINGDNDKLHFNATYNTGGPTVDQLKQTGDGYISMIKGLDETPGKPVIEGNVLTITGTSGDEISQYFCIVGEGTKGVSGKVKYNVADKETAEVAANIIKSVKVK